MDESFESQIAKLQKDLAPLRIEHRELRHKFEAEQTQMARHSSLLDEKEQLEREIAAMKGGHFPGPPPYDADDEYDG